MAQRFRAALEPGLMEIGDEILGQFVLGAEWSSWPATMTRHEPAAFVPASRQLLALRDHGGHSAVAIGRAWRLVLSLGACGGVGLGWIGHVAASAVAVLGVGGGLP